MNVLALLLVGVTGYWYVVGTKYSATLHDSLWALMATAKLDDGMYRVAEWFQKKNRFILYVTKEFRK